MISLVNFNDFLQLVVYISFTLPAISRLQNLQLHLFSATMQQAPTSAHAISSLLHYFTCPSQQTRKLRVAPHAGPHRRRQAWSMTRPGHRGRCALLDSPHPSLLRAEALLLPKCISAPEHFLHDSSFSWRSQNEVSTNIP